MLIRFDTAQDTSTGLKRQVNEDYLGSRIPDTTSPEAEYGALFIVADGVGSLGNGDVASRIAVDTMLRVYYAPETTADTISDRIRQAVIAAHEAVREEATKRGKDRLGTTIVGMVILPDKSGWTFSVGDSRVYEVSDGLRQITVDDAKAGGSNAPLSAFLGQTSKELVVEPKPLSIKDKQVFLICTDGLWKVVDRETVATTVTRYGAKQATRKLIEATLNGGAPDNVTVSIIRIGRPPLPRSLWYTLAAVLLLALLGGGFFAAGGIDLLDGNDDSPVAVAVAEETEIVDNSGISVEPTATTDATATAIASATPEPTATATPTDTLVPTDTPAPSETLTATSTQTLIPTASPEPTVTDLPSATPTQTATPTITPTDTPLPTSTPLPTITPSPTLQPTFTSQPSITPTWTITPTPTPTGTLAPTVTLDPGVITSTPDPNAPSPTPQPDDIGLIQVTANDATAVAVAIFETDFAAGQLATLARDGGVRLLGTALLYINYPGSENTVGLRGLPAGTEVRIVDPQVVTVNGFETYQVDLISDDVIAVDQPETVYYMRIEDLTEGVVPIPPYMTITDAAGAPMRERPNPNAQLIGVIPTGTDVIIIGISTRNNTWFQVVNAAGRIGWVNSVNADVFNAELVPRIEPPTPEPTPAVEETAEVTSTAAPSATSEGTPEVEVTE